MEKVNISRTSAVTRIERRHGDRHGVYYYFVMTLVIAIAAAVVRYIILPLYTPIHLDWNATTGNLTGTIYQQLEGRGQQSLFELAQSITMACGKSPLLRSRGGDIATGTSCRVLCGDHMCCVEEDEEKSCVNDVSKNCPSYAGCIVLRDTYDLNGDNTAGDVTEVANEESKWDSDRNDKQPLETTDTTVTTPVSRPVTWTASTDDGPTSPRDLFLLSGQSNMIGHTTSEWSIEKNGKYWNDIKSILDEAAIAEANGVDDYLSTMEEDLYKVIYEANYHVDNENINRVAETLTNGVMDLYKSSLLNDLDTPLSIGKCSFTEANDTLVNDVSQGTVPIVWNANCGHSFGHELLFSRTLELGMNYTTAFEMHKVARGGSGLYEHWYPNHGEHWDLLKSTIEEGQGYGDWKGFIWHQGSQAAWSVTEHGEDRSMTYLGNLTGLVSEVRELMFRNSINWQCKEEIPVVIVQLGYWPQRIVNAAGQRVRDAQAEFCNNDPRAALVQIGDLSRFYHHDAASFLISGNRIAHAYLEAIGGVVECPDRIPSSSPSEYMQPTINSFESDSPSPTIYK